MRALYWLPLVAAFALVGCESVDSTDDGGIPTASKALPESVFTPAPFAGGSASFPFPNDALFSGFKDPTLNIPNSSNAPFVRDANLTDGYSTTASWFTDFLGFIDFDSASAALRVVDTSTGALLVEGTDFRLTNYTAVDPAIGQPINTFRTKILIEPLKPLKASTRYLAVFTSALKDKSGNVVSPSTQFRLLRSGTPVSQQTGEDGKYVASLSQTQAATLEALRSQAVRPAVEQFSRLSGVREDQITVIWTLTTQSKGKTLARMNADATAKPIGVVSTGRTTADFIPTLPANADVFVGSLQLPYYLNDASTTPGAILSGFWAADATKPDTAASFLGQVPCGAFAQGANGFTASESTTVCYPVPVVKSTQTVPVLVTVPNGQPKPVNGWPVAIFQHGITGNRTQMLAIAPALAAAGFVTIAIDLPLHGLPAGNPFTEPGTTERTFNVDLVNNTSGAPGPDSEEDASGTHFINLSSLITSRDNIRQAVSDLINLTKSVVALDFDGGDGDINTDRIHYIGHSLGGIVGGTLLGVNSDIKASTLAMPGGGIAKLLDASKAFGPRIAGGLAASSVNPVSGKAAIVEGSDNYESFLRFAQHLIDDGDPINYAVAASANRPIHMIEVIGDLVVPNVSVSNCGNIVVADPPVNPGVYVSECRSGSTDTSGFYDHVLIGGPLSGTEPLAQQMGLDVIGPITPPLATADADIRLSATGVKAVVQFANGDHGSILSPAANGAATQEMQRETASFLASQGTCLPVGGSCPTGGAR